MAGENDQTKWRGIRPTNPAENIPVTESAPLTEIDVNPAAGCDDFPVTTNKNAPAISDLQAIKDAYAIGKSEAAKNCTVAYVQSLAIVPANEVWVITNITGENNTSMCDMEFRADINGVARSLKSHYSIPPNIAVNWTGFVVLMTDDHIEISFELGGGADNIKTCAHGYKIGEY